MRLARDGVRELLLSTLLLGGGVAAALILTGLAWWSWLIAAPLLIVWLWVLWFFRDPQRTVPAEAGLFVSPADGRVTDITPIGANSVLGVPGVKVGIFMSIFSVHVNRCPCDAEITRLDYQRGTFLDARHPQAFELNESMTIVARHESGARSVPIAFRQVAGLLARRIVCRLQVGQKVVRGQRFGLIKFGSRAELLLPDELSPQVCVRVGQQVHAGLTVLARVAPTESRS